MNLSIYSFSFVFSVFSICLSIVQAAPNETPAIAAAAQDQDIKTDFEQTPEKPSQPLDENAHNLIRKLAVFPLDTGKRDTEVAEQAWWKIREELTANKRFLVASKQMMNRKEILQPRAQIEPAAAILIGKLIDSHALVSTYLVGRTLHMIVYSCENGMVLWKRDFDLATSIPIAQQIEGASVKLIRDFMASIPYQGYQILDPLIGKPVYEESKSIFAKVESGQNMRIQVGDAVQWIHVRSLPPVFQTDQNITIIAEGTVTENKQGVLTVEIKRLKDKELLTEKSLVRIPSEYQRLKETWALSNSPAHLSPDIFVAEMKSAKPDSDANKNLVMTGTTLSSMLLLLLLAF